MNLLASKKSWLLAPVVFLLSLAALALVWAAMEPAALRAAFDADGVPFFVMRVAKEGESEYH